MNRQQQSNRLGARKPTDECAHITLAMRPYYERRREKARAYARDPENRARAEARRRERLATDSEYAERVREGRRRAYRAKIGADPGGTCEKKN